jgi:lipoprotein-anchoring transpeptidase ErfK/SrfK
MRHVNRRFLLLAGTAAATTGLAGCNSSSDFGLFDSKPPPRDTATLDRPDYEAVYGAYPGEKFPIIPFDYHQVDPAYLRQTVAYRGPEAPGTIVVDPSRRHLYLVEQPGRATRFGVGVGREGFLWTGDAKIQLRRSWPDWIPPHEMVERDPEIRARLAKTPRGLGVAGGPTSPLGARAMYLFANGGDLGYRIHGTTEPGTVGTNVSSGCVRMVNQDICYLYGRAPEGTRVVVLPTNGAKVV